MAFSRTLKGNSRDRYASLRLQCVLNGQHAFLEVATFASKEEQEDTMCEGGVLFTADTAVMSRSHATQLLSVVYVGASPSRYRTD